ncbi:MAG: iron-sulfur cluster assembly protein [Pseudonocardia sp.]|nr:iron-sulfur cluster assembly protein [Pseudonocardia sp.]
MPDVHASAVEAQVWAALETVMDPELDEPITDLGFVESHTVSDDGVATVVLRLPTFFCAPNFAFLMVADAYDAVMEVDGVRHAVVTLQENQTADAINKGVAAQSGFVKAFEGEATAELDELRTEFLSKAAIAGQDRVAQPLVDDGAFPDQLAAMTLGQVPPSVDLDRLRDRRSKLGLPAGDDAPLLMHPDGSRVTTEQVPLHLRRARLRRVGIEANGHICREIMKTKLAVGAP